MLMKKLLPIVLLAGAVAGLGRAALAADQKIAIVNLSKAFDRYYKTIQSNAGLKQEGAEAEKTQQQMVANLKKHEEEWRRLFDKSNDQSLSAEEREKGKKAAEEKYAELENDKQSITEFERGASARLYEKKRQRRDDIVREISGVVKAHAIAGGYTLVLDCSGESANMAPVVLYSNGQDDLTEAVIKDLNAAAPPGSLDINTNTPDFLSATNLPSVNPPLK